MLCAGKAVSPEALSEYVLQCVSEALADGESTLSLVYFHAGFQWAENCPSLHWLQQLFTDLPDAFLQSLSRVYIVHPTVGLRASLFLLSPWMSHRWERQASLPSATTMDTPCAGLGWSSAGTRWFRGG